MKALRRHVRALALCLAATGCNLPGEDALFFGYADTGDTGDVPGALGDSGDGLDTADLTDADVPDPSDVPDADLPGTDLPDTDLRDADVPDTAAPDADVRDADVPDSTCPVARPLCTVRGSTAPPVNDLLVRPLDTLSCNGDSSRDEDGRIVEYIWSVDSAPDGSTYLPEPSNASNTQFFIDSAGRYTLNLTVVDDSGCASQPSPVTIVSRPDADIYVELTWTTPGDLNESDTGFGSGSDLDLHLLHPSGCWTHTSWDCHFRARDPDWGDPGDGDDPSLDLDDTDGGGPEAISLDAPQNGVTYLVGVHYFTAHGFGDALANVKIYIDGEVVFQAPTRTMSDNEWWVVCSIAWPSTLVTPVDILYDDVPTCP